MTRRARFLMVLITACWAGIAHAQDIDPLGELQGAAEEKQSADEAKIEARQKELEAEQKLKRSRVVVLQWPDTDVGHKNIGLQAITRNWLGRPGAVFYPGVDLYQEGRRRRMVRGLPAPPLDQPGVVPPSEIRRIRDELRGLRNRLGSSRDDGIVAAAAKDLVDDVWFNDGPETRALLFDLYVTIGQAVSALRNQVPPWYQVIGGSQNNYYLYQAAGMLWEERMAGGDQLAARVPSSLSRPIEDIVDMIGQGLHPPIPVAFHEGGMFDAKAFAAQYVDVTINGLAREVDETGIVMVPRGRIDVSLKHRERDFGLSERLEVVRLDEKVYFVLEVAKQKLGYDLQRQLMVQPNECYPYLDPTTRATLATYASLHPRDEIYVAIPKLGVVQDMYVWRWDRNEGRLILQLDRNRGFPVRFALLASTGIGFGGGTVSTPSITPASGLPGNAPPGELGKFEPAYVPVDFQLRGHWNRLMFGFGVQFQANISETGGGFWRERFQTGGNYVVDLIDSNGVDVDQAAEVLQSQTFNRLVYGLVGVVILKRASFGLGPRAYIRVGGMNAPHVIDLTAHLGYTADVYFGTKEIQGRVVPILDFDVYGGAQIPYGDTVFDAPIPNLGLTLGAGLTF